MIPQNGILSIQGSLGGEVTRMALDTDSLAHLMGVLTNLYSNPELAVIREYSVNSLDSHIFAGVTDPIEVFTPNAMTGDFIVTDHGLGLSKEEIQNVYGNYGASTKRGSDDVAGCLGLGSKSALAYTSSFSVVGIKDGMKTTAVVGLDEDGAGRIEVVDYTETDERNGVTVRVPVKYGAHFTQTLQKFFSFWDKGTVLVDGKPPVHFSEGLTKIDETVWYSPKGYGITVVMGGVSYSTNDYYFNHLNGSIVVEADMGDVDFTPSREALHMTTRTKDYLKTLVKYTEGRVIDSLQKAVDEATSKRDVVRLGGQIPMSKGLVTWRGLKHNLHPSVANYAYRISPRSCSKRDSVEVASLYADGAAVMINKPFTPMSGLQRDKLEKYLGAKGLDVTRVFYFRDDEIPYLGTEAQIIDFTEVNGVAMPKKPRTKRAEAAKIAAEAQFDYWEFDNTGYTRSRYGVLDPTKTILYIRGKRTDPWRYRNILNYLGDTNVILVHVEATREKLLLRGFPKAAHPQGFIDKKVAAMTAALTDEDWSLAHAGSSLNHVGWLKDRTSDPVITSMYKAHKRGAWAKFVKFMSNAGLSYQVPATVVTHTDHVTENYPLINRYHETESIEYINMVYALRNNDNGKDS